MSEEIRNLMSQRYVEFAEEIIQLVKEKYEIQERIRTEEFTDFACYNYLLDKLYNLDNLAKKAQDKYEAWKQQLNVGDG